MKMLPSGNRLGGLASPATSSADRNWLPSIVPPLAMAPYMRASARAVATPLAAGSSASSSGMSPCTVAFMPGKYIEPNPPENFHPARCGAIRLKIGFCSLLCGPMICAGCVGAPTGGRPRWKPSVLSGSASSVRISSRMPCPVTARARPDISQP